MAEQDHGFNGYSLFMKKVKKLQEFKKGNAKFMTLEEIEKSIKRLEEIDNNSRKIGLEDINLTKKCKLEVGLDANSETIKWLVRPGTNLRFVAVEYFYRTIYEEHLLLNHGGRGIMHNTIKGTYANITVELIIIYEDTCIKCGLKKWYFVTINILIQE